MDSEVVKENTDSLDAQVQIRHAIVHDLIKSRHNTATTELRGQQWPVTALVQRVVDTLIREYRHRASKSHGRFSSGPEHADVPTLIRGYLADGSSDFVPMSQALMRVLCARAGAQSAATGGHVLIAHVRQADQGEGLLIAVLTDEIGAAITEAKELREARYLNMKGFRYAGRIDLDGIAANSDRHVSFLRGSGGDVSDYFKNFLGCDTTIAALPETIKLTAALRGFAAEHLADLSLRARFLGDANAVCAEMALGQEIFEVEKFANRLWPAQPQTLVAALEAPALALSAGFVPHRRGLKGLIRFFGGRDGLWKIEFDRQALLNGDIVFDPAQEALTIRNLPADLLGGLRGELAD